MNPPGVQYLQKQLAVSDNFRSEPSIMFDKSRHLSIKGAEGFVSTELLKIDYSAMTLGRVFSTGHEIELQENANITFLLPRSGYLDILVGDREYKIVPGRPLAFRPTERKTRANGLFNKGFAATTLQVSVNRVARLTEACEMPPGTAFATDATDLAGSVGQILARQLPLLAQDVFLRPEPAPPKSVLNAVAVLVDEQLCELINVTAEKTSSRSILPAFHRVRQAEEIMHARSDEPLSILEIAQSLNVSLRSLQLAFNEIRDLGPRDVLNRIRLEKARQRLLAGKGELQVTVVAFESGFFHLSRFAQAYTRVYGERPSETLARRRS